MFCCTPAGHKIFASNMSTCVSRYQETIPPVCLRSGWSVLSPGVWENPMAGGLHGRKGGICWLKAWPLTRIQRPFDSTDRLILLPDSIGTLSPNGSHTLSWPDRITCSLGAALFHGTEEEQGDICQPGTLLWKADIVITHYWSYNGQVWSSHTVHVNHFLTHCWKWDCWPSFWWHQCAVSILNLPVWNGLFSWPVLMWVLLRQCAVTVYCLCAGGCVQSFSSTVYGICLTKWFNKCCCHDGYQHPQHLWMSAYVRKDGTKIIKSSRWSGGKLPCPADCWLPVLFACLFILNMTKLHLLSPLRTNVASVKPISVSDGQKERQTFVELAGRLPDTHLTVFFLKAISVCMFSVSRGRVCVS